ATVVGSAVASGGSASVTTSTLTEGVHSITAKQTDLAGNTSVASAALSVTIDTTAPAAPATPDLTAATDSGSFSSDNLTNVKIGATVVGSAVASGSSASLTTSTLTEGVHSITAKQTDLAGNTSVASAALSVTNDTTTPAAPATPDLTAATDNGSFSTDNLTNVTTPTFTGTAEAGITVQLFDGTTSKGTATADASGNWSITSSALSSGTHSITAKARTEERREG